MGYQQPVIVQLVCFACFNSGFDSETQAVHDGEGVVVRRFERRRHVGRHRSATPRRAATQHHL